MQQQKKKKGKRTEKKKWPVDPATPVSLGNCAEYCKTQLVFRWCTVKVCSQGLKGDPDVHAGSASVRKSNSCSSVHQLYNVNVTILTSNEARSCRTSQNRLHGIADSPYVDGIEVRDVGHLEPVLSSTDGPVRSGGSGGSCFGNREGLNSLFSLRWHEGGRLIHVPLPLECLLWNKGAATHHRMVFTFQSPPLSSSPPPL